MLWIIPDEKDSNYRTQKSMSYMQIQVNQGVNSMISDDRRTVGQLEAAYLKNKHGQTYIACEDLDFIWTKEEVFDFECQWAEGATLKELARYFRRSQEEILILALDLGMKKRIQPRRGGLIGKMKG